MLRSSAVCDALRALLLVSTWRMVRPQPQVLFAVYIVRKIRVMGPAAYESARICPLPFARPQRDKSSALPSTSISADVLSGTTK